MPTHTYSRGVIAGEPISQRVALTAGAEINIDESIPANSAALQVGLALDVSQLKGIFIVADGELTLKTNSSGAPVNTIVLANGVPFNWIFGDPPLRDSSGAAITTDITSLFLVNADAVNAVTLRIRVLFDPTV